MSGAGIANVTRERYLPSPGRGVAATMTTAYVGNGLRRIEMYGEESSSDTIDRHTERYSEDNGNTWSEWAPRPNMKYWQGDIQMELFDFAWGYDPVSQRTIHTTLRRLYIGEDKTLWDNMYDHTFYQLSEDEGRTLSEPRLLRYEDGPAFDPDDWAKAEYVRTNISYGGYNLPALSNGTIINPFTVTVQEANEAGEIEDLEGVACWIGRWNEAAQDYDWHVSEHVAVPLSVSSRGLMEPFIAELQNGDLMMEMRGSNTDVTPGRKWYSVSCDGGETWTEPTDLCYDDGEQFYAPSTFAYMVRSSRTGKLYWVGNISPVPPQGNSPRYPLYIAEMDEELHALKRDTLTVIDDRDPENDSAGLQLTNFSLFENRETGHFELYLTRLGERVESTAVSQDFWTADVYRYTLELTG